MIIMGFDETEAVWRRTQFRSLLSVKRWATRYGHAWQIENSVLIVSTADGTIHRYREAKPKQQSVIQ